VISGVMTGMRGTLLVRDAGFQRANISLVGEYHYSEWPIPKLFLEFGLEVVLQKFAERLRSLIEADFKAGASGKTSVEKAS
jgi:hypothetical protein